MTFTDDDLKRLKEVLAKTIEPNSDDAKDFCRLAVDNCGALLARLEAAEAVCNNILDECDTWTHESTLHLTKLWRKAAGK